MAELSQKELMNELLTRLAERKFYSIEPYDWQREFYEAGKSNEQRMLMAANRSGKTFAAAFEIACHATGHYPEWWTGFRLTKPGLIWASSLTNETSRDIVQKELLGPIEAMGTGMIPGNLLKKPTYRQTGISGVIDTIPVKGKYGINLIQFKTAEQGWQKFQGTAPDVIWQDEEPDDFRVFTEQIARIITSKGRLMVTFTPLKGETDLVQHFARKEPGMSLHTATWDQALHLDEATKKRFLSAFPEHERETRTKGIPMLGEGAVFTTPDDLIKVAPFEIPPYYRRIAGVDFGVNHPAAGAWLALDPDADILYVYDCYKKKGESNPAVHASIIKHRDPGNWIPVAWPHDGINEEKSSGKRVAVEYAREGVNMLDDSARYDDKIGGRQAVEPIIMDFERRMSEGRLKVFSHLTDWFSEKRGMYRKDGKVMAVNDDIMKACFYAAMMLRYATPQYIQQIGRSSARKKALMSL